VLALTIEQKTIVNNEHKYWKRPQQAMARQVGSA